MVKNTLVNVNPHFVGFNPYISGLSIWLLTTYDLWDDPPSIAMVIWEVPCWGQWNRLLPKPKVRLGVKMAR